MKYLNSLIENIKTHELILGVFFIVYILYNGNMNPLLAQQLNNPIVHAFIFILALSIFLYSHPLVGILGLFVAYEMVNASSGRNSAYLFNYLPTFNSNKNQNKITNFSKYNDFPVTLEEDVVSKLGLIAKNHDNNKLHYKPMLDLQNHAAPINNKGVV